MAVDFERFRRMHLQCCASTEWRQILDKITISCLTLRRPKSPSDNNNRFQPNSSPKRPRKSHRTMRPHTPNHRTSQQQNRCRNPAVPLRVRFQPPLKQPRIRE